MKNVLTLSTLFFVGIIFHTTTVHATSILLDVQDIQGNVAEGPFLVRVLLNPEDDIINAVQMVIEVSGGAFVEEVYDGDTIISHWVEKPHFDASRVTFSGIITGGFDGTSTFGNDKKSGGKVLDIQIRPIKTGPVTITTSGAQALLHDGKGTETQVTSNPITVYVTQLDGESTNQFTLHDTRAPVLVSHEVIHSEELLSGARVLLFDVRDDESGVSYVEISEDGGAYVRAHNVFSLNDGVNTVLIKMVDKAGNVATETVILESSNMYAVSKWYPKIIFTSFIVFILLLSIFLKCKKDKK